MSALLQGKQSQDASLGKSSPWNPVLAFIYKSQKNMALSGTEFNFKDRPL